jgi:hypothetical protein
MSLQVLQIITCDIRSICELACGFEWFCSNLCLGAVVSSVSSRGALPEFLVDKKDSKKEST